MSSLRDIMDVDVEPLESQAIQRSRDVALLQNQPFGTRPTSSLSSTDRSTTQRTVKRKRPSRVSKPSSSAGSSRSGTARRRSSGATELMDPSGYGQGGSQNNMRPSLPRGLEADQPVRYTPVTGRVSKAKKGQPVHVCLYKSGALTTPPTKPRSSKASVQISRFEIQGDGPYRASDYKPIDNEGRSRSSSTSSDPRTPPQKYSPQQPSMNAPSSNYTSPNVQAPTTNAGANMQLSKDYEPIMGSFQAVNVSESSNQRPSSRTDGSESSGLQFSPASGSMSSHTLGTTATYHNIPMGANMAPEFLLGQQSTLGAPFEQSTYSSLGSNIYPSSSAGDIPPLTLQVPDPGYNPSLASPPYNSSDSNWSTPSDVSRQNTAWPRDRALPAGWAAADSLATAAQQQQQQFLAQNMHHIRQQASLDSVPEHFEGSYMSNVRHYSSPIVLCPPADGQGAVEGGGMYNQEDVSDARDYPHQHVYGNNFYQGL
ncbi:hypothetical protein V496_00836 [Pseudogymnoascus sp. VKM F-4515 (FW-2607)]|nr:hypothetical protein V496_00836 [Pseudogymnoascus sp. VKM F-4515 (FW-2607)]